MEYIQTSSRGEAEHTGASQVRPVTHLSSLVVRNLLECTGQFQDLPQGIPRLGALRQVQGFQLCWPPVEAVGLAWHVTQHLLQIQVHWCRVCWCLVLVLENNFAAATDGTNDLQKASTDEA